MSPRLLGLGLEGGRVSGLEWRGGRAGGSVPATHTGLTVLRSQPVGTPQRNRAPFDGSKQCLMTRAHLIRLSRLQEVWRVCACMCVCGGRKAR